MPKGKDDLRSKFARLTEISRQLNDETDGVNGILQSAEERLQQVSPGVSASVRLNVEDTTDFDGKTACRVHHLTYRRGGQGWKLYVEESICELIEQGTNWAIGDTVSRKDDVLLSDAPRDLRIEAAGKLPDLLDALAEAAAKKLERVRRVTLCDATAIRIKNGERVVEPLKITPSEGDGGEWLREHWKREAEERKTGGKRGASDRRDKKS